MKLEEGMYVRTKEGIRKIEDIWNDMYGLNRDLHYRYPEGHCLYEEDIEKVVLKEPSFNPIDLIEVGDIITYEFPTGLGMLKYENVTVLESLLDTLKSSDEYTILSIVTKEQFESIKYSLEG